MNLYTKSSDKRLYYKDDAGVEIGPIASASGAQTNVANTFTAGQNIDADFHTKGPNPSYDVTRFGFGGYIGPNYTTGTTGSVSNASTSLTVASALDFANTQGILILGAGPAPTIATPTGLTAAPVGVTGSATYTYCVVDEDYANGKTACSAAASVATAVTTIGIQTATISACNRVSGVVTCTTTAPHNFISGSQVEIPRGTTGDFGFEGAFTLASASGSTFTYNQYGVADKVGVITTGTARVAGRVQLLWNAPTTPYGTLKHLIYRCSTTCALPANAANFALVGVATGQDSSFIDAGYTMSVANLDNGDASATAPTTASNQWLSTTIAAGGGTTALTLANAASNTVSGAKVLHDNTPNLNAACAAFPLSTFSTGGTLMVPATTNATWKFPITSTWNMSTACPINTEVDWQTQVYLGAPVIPRSYARMKGFAPANVHQSTPFYGMGVAGVFGGTAAPLLYLVPGTSHDIAIESLFLSCANPYQTCIYQDEDTNGNGVVSLHYTDVFPTSGNTSTAYVMKGGFGYFWDRGGWYANASDFTSRRRC